MPRKLEYIRLEARQRFRKYRCRCSRCERRMTTRRNPRQMVKSIRCSCGNTLWRVDWYRTTKREHRKVICFCGGRHFPHRYGSCEVARM